MMKPPTHASSSLARSCSRFAVRSAAPGVFATLAKRVSQRRGYNVCQENKEA